VALKRRGPVSGLALSFGVAAFLALAGNLAFWRALVALVPADSPGNLGFLASTFVILLVLLGLLLLLFAYRFVLKPVAIAALLISGVCAHFTSAYGVVIDRSMIQNVLETDVGEASELLTSGLLFHALLLGVLPALLVARLPLRFGSLGSEARARGLAALASLALCAVLIGAHFKEFSLIGREHEELRLLINPTSPIYAAVRFLRGDEREPGSVAPIAADARRAEPAGGERPLLVVLVVGETARAASFSLNGYARDTNPRLAALPVIDFPQVSSCGTSTAVSVPCMFSPYGRAGYSDRKAKSHESLLDVLQRVGVSVLWRDNNSGCKSTCDRVPRQTSEDLAVPRLCSGGECFDEVLVEGLPAFVGALRGDALVVLHMKGSHGPAYARRSPAAFKKFMPECASADLPGCGREAIVNAYDNTILYTDFVLSRLIDLLEREAERFDVAMLYVSDHGESLGEAGLYLHGLPWLLAPDEQKHVPMLLWISEAFGRDRGIDRACLEGRREARYSHDHLFHSILGLFEVRTSAYSPDLDLFRPCRSAPISVTSAR
jgi:lipid A ethanolaminephosphotransferase